MAENGLQHATMDVLPPAVELYPLINADSIIISIQSTSTPFDVYLIWTYLFVSSVAKLL